MRTKLLPLTLLVALGVAFAQNSGSTNTPPSQGTPPQGGSGGNGSPANGTTPPLPSNPQNPTLPGANNPTPNAPNAQDTGSNTNTQSSTINDNNLEALVLQAIQQSNRFEIESSTIALKKQVSAATRDFANMMITEHTKAQTQVAQLAQKKNVGNLPKDSGPLNRMVFNALNMLNGAAFQTEYWAAQANGHANTIKALRAYVQMGKDAEVKALVQKLLPSVQSHYYMATRLIATKGRSNGAMAKSMNMPKSSTPQGGNGSSRPNNAGGTNNGGTGSGSSGNGSGGNGSGGNGAGQGGNAGGSNGNGAGSGSNSGSSGNTPPSTPSSGSGSSNGNAGSGTGTPPKR